MNIDFSKHPYPVIERMTLSQLKEGLTVLEKTDELLTVDMWIKNNMYLDDRGFATTDQQQALELFNEKKLCGMCLVGAACLAANILKLTWGTMNAFNITSKQGIESLPAFNDTHSYDQVKEFLKTTIERTKDDIRKASEILSVD